MKGNTHIVKDVFPEVHCNKLKSSYQRPGEVVKVCVTIVWVITGWQTCVVRRTGPEINSTYQTFCVASVLFLRTLERVKILKTRKKRQRNYTLKCLIRDLLSNAFLVQSQVFRVFKPLSGRRELGISVSGETSLFWKRALWGICIRFSRHLLLAARWMDFDNEKGNTGVQ